MSTATYVGAMDLIENIESGRLDGSLEQLKEAVAGRERELKGAWRNAIRPGFRVRINQSASPRYWRGHTGTVVSIGSGVNCIKVELDDSVYRRNGNRIPAGTRIDCRRSLLEPEE